MSHANQCTSLDFNIKESVNENTRQCKATNYSCYIIKWVRFIELGKRNQEMRKKEKKKKTNHEPRRFWIICSKPCPLSILPNQQKNVKEDYAGSHIKRCKTEKQLRSRTRFLLKMYFPFPLRWDDPFFFLKPAQLVGGLPHWDGGMIL